ncbi:helix-turn-helix domain-containing protein [Actinocrispum wychmicini]|uniref:Helix-turn-helix protein n=1 Tax=Actinocrispum wychmicini TaxID=1213861 RepID=A0A4R2J3J6_9PSEU|nr:helix-turn-helix transcriptional regulator [Actinocrispum wychmicini]TCO53073.1 helix-turn-helix protein [Actinocrispum wychmicini]
MDYEEQQRHRTAEVVLYWMRRRGLTRQVFADRMGRSLSWVDKIRNGDRQLDRLSVLRQIASVLDVSLATLIEPAQIDQAKRCPDDREVAAIRAALARYDVTTNIFRPNGDVLPEPNLATLERLVRYGWMAFQAANYQAIGELLPNLIRDAQASVWQLDGVPQTTARTWLAWTYQLTAATAFKLGDAQLGWMAADRSIQLAEQTEDPTLIGSAARRVAYALIATGQSAQAVQLVRAAADRLSPHLTANDPAFVSCYGMLLLKGSIAAARLHQAAEVRDLQAEALTVAERLGVDRNENWTAFGATNVRVHKIAALADMQAGGLVIEAAQAIPSGDLLRLPRERRASYLLDVTRGYLQWGKRDAAAVTLLDADQLAPEEVRCRQLTRQILADLVRSYPRGLHPPTPLANIARAVGVAV